MNIRHGELTELFDRINIAQEMKLISVFRLHNTGGTSLVSQELGNFFQLLVKVLSIIRRHRKKG